MNESNRIWVLMGRSLSGEASPEEMSELNDSLHADIALQQQYELLKRFWVHPSLIDSQNMGQEAVDKIIRLSHGTESGGLFTISIRRHKTTKIFIAGIAASVLLIAGSFFFGHKAAGRKDQPIAKNHYSVDVKYGNRSKTTLADGTTVWLNAGSTLEYGNFSDSLREVVLHGEAYFTVTHQPKRPFVVHVDGMDVKVLGTTFNVKSYPDDKTVETTLLNGAVEVIKKDGTKPIFLKPNQKIVLYKKLTAPIIVPSGSNQAATTVLSGKFNLTYLDTAYRFNERVETSWVYNRLIFRGENFEQLAKKMERWFNVKIIFSDDAAKHLNFYGSFENETVEQAFEALQAAVPFKYKINPQHEIYISTP